MNVKMDPNAKYIIDVFAANGFEAFAVGGCVRDALMGLAPHDWDICTNAKPEQIKSCFADENTFDSGLKHGTISVVLDKTVYEVTTYRIDGEYDDNRHPNQVSFTDDIKLDLSRRDFTVNAMAYNDSHGLIDPFGGAEDLKKNLLRCVGDPDKRFNEDALRIMRGLRFASTYGFTVEEKTALSIKKNAPLLHNIASERISVELNRLLCGDGAEDILNRFRDVIAEIIPEMIPTFDCPQNTPHHKYFVWEHITHSVGLVPKDEILRMVMLLHDIGKPRARTTDENGRDHFKFHPKISIELARNILSRLRYSNAFISDCLLLIEKHDFRFNGKINQIKRVLQQLGEKNTRRLFLVQRADIMAQSEYLREEKLAAVDLAEAQLEEIISQGQCFSLKNLAVNGRDLINIGITDGKQIGIVLYALLDEVIDNDFPNDKKALIERAENILQTGTL